MAAAINKHLPPTVRVVSFVRVPKVPTDTPWTPQTLLLSRPTPAPRAAPPRPAALPAQSFVARHACCVRTYVYHLPAKCLWMDSKGHVPWRENWTADDLAALEKARLRRSF